MRPSKSLSLRFAALAFAAWVAAMDAASAQDAARDYRIAEQSLGQALREFALASNLDLLFSPDLVAGKKSSSLDGKFTVDEGLRTLLRGSGLEFSVSGSRVVISEPKIEPARQATSSAPQRTNGYTWLAQADMPAGSQGATAGERTNVREHPENRIELEEIVVTGTHIRGSAPVGSSLTTYTREDIERTGVARIDQFLRKLPQNFASVDASTALAGATASGVSQGGANIYGGAGINLHGLSPGATLTLLNGHRLAPSGSEGGFVDISMIPLSAVERVEILSDGASALYGADAVAGVVNFILRTDYEGAETSVRYGASTHGDLGELTASQLLGTSWNTGNILLTLEHDKQESLLTSDRDFIPLQSIPWTLAPENRRDSVFISARQALADHTTVFGDALYSDRHLRATTPAFAGANVLTDLDSDAKNVAATAGLEQKLSGSWSARLTGYYSRSDQTLDYLNAGVTFQSPETEARLAGIDLLADGSLFALGSGRVRGAIGGSFRTEKLDNTERLSDTSTNLKRNISSLYAEVGVPLLRDDRLALSLAARYDHYDDFGSSTNPKVGIAWQALPGLQLRASYATAFHPPLLTQLSGRNAYFTFDEADPNAPDLITTTLFDISTANPDLDAEESQSYSAGFELKPALLEGLSITATYFRTKFKNRIDTPPVLNLFDVYSQVDVLAPFINRSPDPAAVARIFADPGFIGDFAGHGEQGVEAIFDNRKQNIARTDQSSIELASAYSKSAVGGTLGLSLSGTYLLKTDYQTAPQTPNVSVINKTGKPVDLRLLGSVSWSRGTFAASASVNYWDSYSNDFFTPAGEVSSWTTADLTVSYTWQGALKSTLSIQNLADKAPPFVAIPPELFNPVGYDAANANPFGRVIALALSKRW